MTLPELWVDCGNVPPLSVVPQSWPDVRLVNPTAVTPPRCAPQSAWSKNTGVQLLVFSNFGTEDIHCSGVPIHKKMMTYDSRDSLLVTHATTSLPINSLSTAERTGSADTVFCGRM
jgi:hypothetical protein